MDSVFERIPDCDSRSLSLTMKWRTVGLSMFSGGASAGFKCPSFGVVVTMVSSRLGDRTMNAKRFNMSPFSTWSLFQWVLFSTWAFFNGPFFNMSHFTLNPPRAHAHAKVRTLMPISMPMPFHMGNYGHHMLNNCTYCCSVLTYRHTLSVRCFYV